MSLPAAPHLSLDELRRYSRQLLVPEWREAGAQERLRSATVLVVGAGGLGGPVATALAGAGVGRLRIADGDHVALSNLHRQTHFTSADIGRPKASVLAARAQAINPHVRPEVFPFLTPDNAPELLRGVALAVDATDNFEARYALADACAVAGVPCVWGAVAGTSAMVSVFGGPGGGNLRDLFPDPEGADSCAETGVLGPLPAVVGGVMALEALKVIGGYGEPLWGRLWTLEALSGEVRVIRLPGGAGPVPAGL